MSVPDACGDGASFTMALMRPSPSRTPSAPRHVVDPLQAELAHQFLLRNQFPPQIPPEQAPVLDQGPGRRPEEPLERGKRYPAQSSR